MIKTHRMGHRLTGRASVPIVARWFGKRRAKPIWPLYWISIRSRAVFNSDMCNGLQNLKSILVSADLTIVLLTDRLWYSWTSVKIGQMAPGCSLSSVATSNAVLEENSRQTNLEGEGSHCETPVKTGSDWWMLVDDLVRFCDGKADSYGDGEMAREFFSWDRIGNFDRVTRDASSVEWAVPSCCLLMLPWAGRWWWRREDMCVPLIDNRLDVNLRWRRWWVQIGVGRGWRFGQRWQIGEWRFRLPDGIKCGIIFDRTGVQFSSRCN